MDADLSSPQQLSFFVALLVAGYLTVRVIVPPNRTPHDERAWRADALWFARSAFIINLAILSSSALILYHAALTALPPAAAARVCPAPEQPNPALFRWSPVTAAAFLAVLAGAPLRMGAFSGLGKNFTFGLARPSGLVTTGIYAQVQHPSYTGMWLVAVASFAVFVRPDGALACFVPPVYWPRVQAWAATLMVGAGLLVAQQIATRVAQEEAMLKELFGKEWEAWHAKTKRFVPGLF